MTRNLKMHGGYTRRKIKALSERGICSTIFGAI